MVWETDYKSAISFYSKVWQEIPVVKNNLSKIHYADSMGGVRHSFMWDLSATEKVTQRKL